MNPYFDDGLEHWHQYGGSWEIEETDGKGKYVVGRSQCLHIWCWELLASSCVGFDETIGPFDISLDYSADAADFIYGQPGYRLLAFEDKECAVSVSGTFLNLPLSSGWQRVEGSLSPTVEVRSARVYLELNGAAQRTGFDNVQLLDRSATNIPMASGTGLALLLTSLAGAGLYLIRRRGF